MNKTVLVGLLATLISTGILILLTRFFFRKSVPQKPFKLRLIIDIPALCIIFLGAVVILGWHYQNTTLIQILPQFAPMQYNTALGFILAGAGILCIGRSTNLSYFFAIAILLIGVLTLIEYIFSVNLGIDELIMRADIITKVSHPGRMAPNTALCFSLIGLALLSCRNAAIMLGLTFTLFALSVMAILGYLLGLEGLYGIATLTHMALHTAASFIILAITLFLYCNILVREKLYIWQLLPVIVPIIMLTLSLFIWHTLEEGVAQHNKKHFELMVTDKTSAIKKRFALYEQALLGGAGFIKGSTSVSHIEWRRYVQALNLKKYLPGANGVGYIDSVKKEDLADYIKSNKDIIEVRSSTQHKNKYIIRYIEPKKNNLPALGLDIGAEVNRKKAADRARDEGEISLTKIIYLVQDNKKLPGFLLLAPVYKNNMPLTSKEQRKVALLGWVYSPFMARKFMNNLQDRNAHQVAFQVYDGKKIRQNAMVYNSLDIPSQDPKLSKLKYLTTLRLGGQNWTFVWKPSILFKPSANIQLPTRILILSLILTAIFSVLFYLLSRLYSDSSRSAQDAKQRLNNLFDQVVDGIITINKDGKIVSYNRSCEQIFGYSSKEVMGLHIIRLIPSLSLKNTDEHIGSLEPRSAENIITAAQEAIATRKNKEHFPIDISISKIDLLGTVQYSVIIRDVTKQKKIQKEIKDSQKFLKLIMDNIPDLVFVKDVNYKIVQANKAFMSVYPKEKQHQIIGYTTVEEYNKSEADLFLEMDKKALTKGYSETKETLDLPNGEKRILYTQKIRFYNEEKESFILGLSRDITESEKLDRMKSEFISTVNHELRTPLTSIKGSLGLLKLKAEASLDEKGQRLLTIANENCTLLSQLVDDILDMEKIAAGKMVYHREDVEMSALIRKIIEQHHSYAAKHHVTFQDDIKISPIYCHLDRNRFTQALANLLSNAAKFSHKNGIVTVTLQKKNATTLQISVSDKGIGIPAEFHNKIFHKFSQVDSSSTRAKGGSGLGLHITKSIIESFDGKVYFETQANVGSTFYFLLPIIAEPAQKEDK